METKDDLYITLSGVSEIRKSKQYKLNINTINSIGDIKKILQDLDLQFVDTHWLSKISDKYKIEVK